MCSMVKCFPALHKIFSSSRVQHCQLAQARAACCHRDPFMQPRPALRSLSSCLSQLCLWHLSCVTGRERAVCMEQKLQKVCKAASELSFRQGLSLSSSTSGQLQHMARERAS